MSHCDGCEQPVRISVVCLVPSSVFSRHCLLPFVGLSPLLFLVTRSFFNFFWVPDCVFSPLSIVIFLLGFYYSGVDD